MRGAFGWRSERKDSKSLTVSIVVRMVWIGCEKERKEKKRKKRKKEKLERGGKCKCCSSTFFCPTLLTALAIWAIQGRGPILKKDFDDLVSM